MDYNWIIIFSDGGDSEEGFCISRKFDPRTLLFGLNYFFLSLIVFPVCTNVCGQTSVEGSELIFENVMPSDGGLYSCMASNPVGTTIEDFQLISKALVVASGI